MTQGQLQAKRSEAPLCGPTEIHRAFVSCQTAGGSGAGLLKETVRVSAGDTVDVDDHSDAVAVGVLLTLGSRIARRSRTGGLTLEPGERSSTPSWLCAIGIRRRGGRPPGAWGPEPAFGVSRGRCDQLRRVRGSPKRPRTLLSTKWVIAETRSPARVSTSTPTACAIGVCESVR